MTLKLKYVLCAIMLASCFLSHAQSGGDNGVFKRDAFSQSYNSDSDSLGRDSTDAMFTFKEFFGGLKKGNTERIGVLFAGSTVFVGTGQIYNGDTWKLPITYGGMAAGIAGGIAYRQKWRNTGNKDFQHLSNWFFAGAGLVYWATLMDEIAYYPDSRPHSPGRATLYSLLLPGLGQAYNGEYWKIPIYYALMAGSAHFLISNNTNYHRYKRIHNEATTPDQTYEGPIPGDTALYYRDVFRRYRDYSIVALAGFYLLQVIDANVFSYMRDFEIGDDLTMNVRPAVLAPDNAFAMAGMNAGFGLSVGFTF